MSPDVSSCKFLAPEIALSFDFWIQRRNFRSILVDGLNRETGPDLDQDEVTARVFKVSSLANGEVSLVFHVDGKDADMALGYLRLRGVAVKLALTIV